MMNRMTHRTGLGVAAFALATALAAPAAAQSGDLFAMDDDALDDALETRYDAALAATLDPAIINALDSRFHWASEAKAQCAIALGFMDRGLRDEDSIRKCDAAYGRLIAPPPAPTPPPPPPAPTPPPAEVCDNSSVSVFFDFDSSTPTGNTADSASYLVKNAPGCGWSQYSVVGHTDRAGSNAYNDALSIRRANAVAGVLQSMGVNPSAINATGVGETDLAVPTVDGERNPQNRRVVISVR